MFYHKRIWVVQVGIFVNTLGWGAVLPFEVIYLHDSRGIGLGTAGAVVGVLTGVGVVGAPVAGPAIDRFGARATAVVAGVLLAAGYAGLALAHSALAAFAAALVGGLGNGALTPSQSTLLATLAPRERRHRVGAVSRVSTNAGFGLGGAIGGVVASAGTRGIVALLLANAVTYVIYAGLLVAVVHDEPRPEPTERAGGYGVVVRDRALARLVLANVVVIAVGWGALPWLVPPFARAELGTSARAIGILMLANAATVVVAQVPIARLAEGRRRVVMMTAGSAAIAVAFLLVTVGSYPWLLAAAIVVGVGECFHTAVLVPLVVELAPPGLRGRYLAALGLSWWVGLALAPTAGTQLLAVSATLAFASCAAAAGAAALSFLALDRRLPHDARHTPVVATYAGS